MAPLLAVEDLHVSYNGIRALQGISLTVEPGEIVTLIGANGAGKSTTLNALVGLVRAAQGRVVLDGEDITRCKPHQVVKRGVVQVPEGRRVFAWMSVRENLELGAFLRPKSPEVQKDLDYVFQLFPVLAERRGQSAGTLSGGEQQMLAIGRGLMARPRLLLLDEPSLGLAPQLVKRIFTTIRDINAQGVTILLVEQNAHMALNVAARAYVLETGRIVLADTAAACAQNPMVREAYLGD